jgi:hypothetical protein
MTRASIIAIKTDDKMLKTQKSSFTAEARRTLRPPIEKMRRGKDRVKESSLSLCSSLCEVSAFSAPLRWGGLYIAN